MRRVGIFSLMLLMTHYAIECESTVRFKLENVNGGVFSKQKVELTDLLDNKKYQGLSNDKGEADIKVPCLRRFKVIISNYSRSSEVKSPAEGGTAFQSLRYSPNMNAFSAKLAMNEQEKKAMDDFAIALPDSFNLPMIQSQVNAHPTYFIKLVLTLRTLDGKPLAKETFNFSGEKRKKKFTGITGNNGTALIYLPKGDLYHLNFKYSPDFAAEEIEYTKANSIMDMNFAYLGTAEMEKRLKEEAERIALEEARLKKEEAEFEAWCKMKKVTPEEGMRLKLKEQLFGEDTVILAVMNRNKWKNRLIVCDLTGSMSPFATQLSMWYQLVHKSEKNMQFVFFNDGDNKPDNSKLIGSTGGIYYTPAIGLDSLSQFMAKVATKGYGGDCAENNMEALIKGVKMAKPFKDIVMIADNHAPVKDIRLLQEFKLPVHIILCGAIGHPIQTDYLDIARKTGGSIHTIEEDIVNLATLSEGEDIKINGMTYKVMGGKFILLKKT